MLLLSEIRLNEHNPTTTIRLNDYNPCEYFRHQVASDVLGHLPQQCRERYMTAAFLAQLTSGFRRVSTSLLCVYDDSRGSSRKPAPSPSPRSSLTHAHRSLGYRNKPQPLAKSARLMYLGVYDSRVSSCKPAPSPCPRSSLTHAHRSIGYRNKPQPLPKSARLNVLEVVGIS